MNWDKLNNDNNGLGYKIRNGDEHALAKYIDLNSSWMMDKAMRMLNNYSDAEDAVSEIFANIWHNIDKWNPNVCTFSIWCAKICNNTIMDAARDCTSRNKKNKRFVDHCEYINIHKIRKSAEETLISREILLKIEDHVEYLPIKMRIVYILRRLEGYNTKDVMRIIGMTKVNVNTILHRAEQKLAIMLEGVTD